MESLKTAVRLAEEIHQTETSHDWTQVEMPSHGSAVAMGHGSRLHHVGLYLDLDRGKVLHCRQVSGVVFQTTKELHRDGYSRIEFYTHREWSA